MGVMYKIVEGECPSLPDKYSKNLHSILKKYEYTHVTIYLNSLRFIYGIISRSWPQNL